MECFNWLHLTDLHWGSDDHQDYWGSIEPVWFEDIDRLQEKCRGEWDAVFFTGDLVNRGEKSEFVGLTERLKRLFDHLDKTGSQPALLVIPGNHDLQRPSPSGAGCKALKKLWDTDEEIRNSIWRKEEDTDYWKTIKGAFENFCQWWDSTRNLFPIPTGMKPGLLPGEFAVTLEKGQNGIGVVGLNTAFLQLSDGLYKGKLDAHPAQVTELCNTDHQDWVNRHDVCIILTHHPMDWLSPLGKDKFESVIAPPGRFALHLCGHQHEASMAQFILGGAPDARRTLCGSSLFGLKKYVDWQKNTEIDRRHGYSAGFIDFSKPQPALRVWPRLGIKKSDKVWRFERDQEFYLEDDGGIKEIFFETNKKKSPRVFKKQPGDTKDTDLEIKSELSRAPVIKSLVKENITQLLEKEKLKDFRRSLMRQLDETNKGKKLLESHRLAAALVNKKILEAVSILDLALKKSIDDIKGASGSVELINFTWTESVKILGWLVLLGVDEEWAESTIGLLAEKNVNVELTIPVKTGAGVEIVVSRLKEAGASLDIDEKTRDVVGDKGFNLDPLGNIDAGWNIGDKVLTIKRALWKQLIKVSLPENTVFKEDMNIDLNETIKAKNERGEHHYIAVDRSCQYHPLLEKDVFEALVQDLPDLDIFFIELSDEEVAIISETRLHSRLRLFFENKPGIRKENDRY